MGSLHRHDQKKLEKKSFVEYVEREYAMTFTESVVGVYLSQLVRKLY